MFLGIDLGSSEIKVILMDESGAIQGTARTPLEMARPRPRWSEQSPEAWWQGTLRAVDELGQKHRSALSAVRGVGLSGQMHGATVLDEANRPLRPAILWNDMRSDEQCRELLERCPEITNIAGNLPMPGLTAPKLLWMAQEEPQLFQRVHTVLLPKDYLRLRLSGEKVSDMSDAAGTLWLNVAERKWSEELLEATALTTAHVPRLVEGSAVSGELRSEWAERWGMTSPVFIAGGAGDNAASAVGVGAIASGDAFLSLGTSGVIFVVDDSFCPAPASAVHTFCHTVPRRWHRMSVMLSAASSVSWAASVFGAKDPARVLADVALLDESSVDRAPIFLPYLSGERTPHNDPWAQGVFFGLTHGTTLNALEYAVVEGVTFGLADGMAALQATSAPVASLCLVGGGARSAWWAQLIADALQVRVHMHSHRDTSAALGAARLAHIACGAKESEVCSKPESQAEFQPRPTSAARLADRLSRFRELYAALRPQFQRRADAHV
jgi:xylulokinase